MDLVIIVSSSMCYIMSESVLGSMLVGISEQLFYSTNLTETFEFQSVNYKGMTCLRL